MRIIIIMLFSALISNAQTIIPLYEGKAPGSESWNWEQKETSNNPYKVRVAYNIVTPTLTVYLPSQASSIGTGIIVAPGGGFHVLGFENEASDIAKWLNSKGIAAFVLHYRLVHCKTDDPFKEMQPLMEDFKKFDKKIDTVVKFAIADGLKAVEYVRNHAEEYNISSTRIGMMGFSAGGTVTMGTVFKANAMNRPNFAAVFYPYMNILKNETVPNDAPPLFICAASDDKLGLASHSSNLYNSWLAAKKEVELHMYEKGNHGFASFQQGLPVDTWKDRFTDWMDSHGWLWPDKPKGFYATFTPNQAKKMRQDEAERLKTDWAYKQRYADENSKLDASIEKRVVFLGSSRIENWKKFDSEFFTKNPSYLDRGVSGQTSSQMLLRFRDDVINLKPAVVVFSGGSNDIAQNTGVTTLEAIAGNVETMILLAKANGIKFVLCSEMPVYDYPWKTGLQPAEKIVALNKLYKALAEKYKETYVDVYPLLVDERKGLKKEFQSDEVHPNQAGYRVIEPLVQKAINDVLKK